MQIQNIQVRTPYFKGNRELRKIKREIKPLLDSCCYSKKNIIENPKNLYFKTKGKKLYMTGFYTPDDKNGELSGICEELSYKAGKILEEKYKGEYIPVCVSTRDFQHGFDEHCCIFLLKDNKQTRQLKKDMEKLAQYSEQINILQSQFMKNERDELKIQRYHMLKKAACELSQRTDQRINEHNLFEDGIFVDPSFGVVEKYKKIKDYKLSNKFYTLESNNPYNKNITGRKIDGVFVPLGFVEDIFPELYKKEDYLRKTIVAMFVNEDNPKNQKIDIALCDFNHNRVDSYNLQYLKNYYSTSEITAFLEEINRRFDIFKAIIS